MVLIILYLLSSILIFIGIEPFKTTGIFLTICYLPGFCLFSFLKGEKLVFEDLILAFPCSIGVSSILILLLLFLGLPIDFIPGTIQIISGIAVIYYVITKKKSYPHVELNAQEIRFCLFAFLAVLVFSIPTFLFFFRPVGPIADHAFLHSSIVSTVLNGIFPPENPGLGGAKIGFYWGFHSLIAALTVGTNFQQLQIIFILNVISFFSIFFVAYGFARALALSEKYCYILPLASIGLMRADAGILFLVKFLSGNLNSLGDLTSSMALPDEIIKKWAGGLPWYDPRLFFLSKIYNVSGMPLAIALCLSYFFLLFYLLKKGTAAGRVYLVGVSIVILSCLINYPPVAIIPLFHLPIWTCYIFLITQGNFKEKIKEVLKILLPYIIAGLITLPHLLYIVKIGQGDENDVMRVDFYSQSIKNLFAFLLPLPIIIYGFKVALKRFSTTTELWFIIISTLLCLILAVFLRLPLDDSYKFNYILTFFLALFFVVAFSNLIDVFRRQFFKKVFAVGVVFFLLLTPFVVELSYIASFWLSKQYFAFSDKHIVYASDKTRNEAYEWIRRNTPPDTLLILSYAETPLPCCGLNPIYEPAALAERNLFIIKDTDFTAKNPEYAERVRIRNQLLNNASNSEVIHFVNILQHPLYFFVEDKMPGASLDKSSFKQFQEDPGDGFELVFHNGRQRVYRLRFSKMKET